MFSSHFTTYSPRLSPRHTDDQEITQTSKAFLTEIAPRMTQGQDAHHSVEVAPLLGVRPAPPQKERLSKFKEVGL